MIKLVCYILNNVVTKSIYHYNNYRANYIENTFFTMLQMKYGF